LTDSGSAAAARIADTVGAMVPDGVPIGLYSSDLRRAAATGAAIADRLGVAMACDRDLREKSYGEADGKAQQWLDARFVPLPAHGKRLDHVEGIAGAETQREFATRVYAAVERVLSSVAERIVAVTRGFALRFVVTTWLGMPVEAFGYGNLRSTPGGITVLREDDYFHNRQVVNLNQDAHFSGGTAEAA